MSFFDSEENIGAALLHYRSILLNSHCVRFFLGNSMNIANKHFYSDCKWKTNFLVMEMNIFRILSQSERGTDIFLILSIE